MPWYVMLLIVLAVMTVPFFLGGYLARRLKMPDHGWRIGVILWALAAGSVVTVMGWPPHLGIDLSGGVILVYEVDQEKKDKAFDKSQMEKLIAAVSRRVNPGGVKEVTIREYGVEQIEIIVPEADEAELKRLKKIVSSVGTLEFRILANNRDHKSLIERAEQEPGKQIKDSSDKVLAWWVPVQLGEEKSFDTYTEIAKRMGKIRGKEMLEVLVVKDSFDVNGGYLERALPDVDRRGRPCVTFIFNSDGGQLFGGLTGNNLPDEVQKDFTRKLGIILDGFLYSAPSIQSTIHDRGEITGDFTQDEVKSLVGVLNAGALPTALSQDPISEMLTGPTLGRDTIKRGKYAMLASMIIVLLFMLVYYRFAGIVASGALLMNLVLILGVMISINAAFTLPGLAGLVLTVGMAVDANVLVFERIREELDRGAALRMAIRNGFARATTTIVDANLTTLIVATVLYVIGHDQIKGFAVILWLGVVLSMFTAIFCSRVVFDIAERRRWITELHMMRILGRTKIDFLGMRYVAAVVSIAVIVIGMAGVVARGKGLLDIDFTGGVSVEVLFDRPQDVKQVRDALGDMPDLMVSDSQRGGEQSGLRFVINTSLEDERDPNTKKVTKPAVNIVEEHLQEVFVDKDTKESLLAHNTLTVSGLGTIVPGEKKPAKKDEKPAEKPSEKDQTRADLPPDWQLASADSASILLAQAEKAAPSADATKKAPEAPPAKPEPAKQPEKKPVEAKPKEAPATKAPAGKAPAEKPAKATQEKPKEAPAEKPVEAPKEAPAEKPVKPSPAKPDQAPAEEKQEEKETPKASGDPFLGGTVAELSFSQAVDHDSLYDMFKEEFESASVSKEVAFELSNPDYAEGKGESYGNWTVKILLPADKAGKLFDSIGRRLADTPFFPSSNSIGGRVAGSTQVQAIYALLASLLFIVGYIWIRFQRVMFGLAAVVALVHDVLITLGMIALSFYVAPYLGVLLIDPFKISLAVLAAFLTIIGYSLNDTIVVFDRIREVRGKAPHLTGDMINSSINQTLSRTLLTSLTTLLVVVVLYVAGGQAIHAFAFSLVVGVVVGTYSSVFVASPVLFWMSRPARPKTAGQGASAKTAKSGVSADKYAPRTKRGE